MFRGVSHFAFETFLTMHGLYGTWWRLLAIKNYKKEEYLKHVQRLWYLIDVQSKYLDVYIYISAAHVYMTSHQFDTTNLWVLHKYYYLNSFLIAGNLRRVSSSSSHQNPFTIQNLLGGEA